MNDNVHTEGGEVDTKVGIKDATVTVKKAVDGTKKRRTRSDKGKPRRSATVTELHTHIRWEAEHLVEAQRAVRPGERLVLDSATEAHTEYLR